MPKNRVRTHVNPLSILKEVTFEGFPNTNPIIVDVGSFKGEFLEGLLEIFPHYNFIGFELRTPIANRLKEKFKDKPQVQIFDGDANRNFYSVLSPCLKKGASIPYVFVNFPDPWFKARHHKRRFIRPDFLANIATWMPKETVFVFQTDQKGLFEDTLEYLSQSPYKYYERFYEPPFGLQTDWEKAKSAEGATIYRLRFWRDKTLKPQSFSKQNPS